MSKRTLKMLSMVSGEPTRILLEQFNNFEENQHDTEIFHSNLEMGIMEHSWYLFPGQTLENTKIKDRGKALIATSTAWKKITDHLTKKQNQQEIIDIEQAHRQYLKDGSYNMTKNWDNSIEKIRQRRMEEHDRKIRDREENLYKRFIELRKDQMEERKQIVEEARKRIFMIKQDSRTLNSSLLLTEVLHERGMQLDFDAKERERERIKADEYAALVKYNANQEKIENKEKQRKRRETDVKHSKELMEHIKKKEAETRQAKEEKIAAEVEDNKRAADELKAIEEYEFLLDRKKKAEVKRQFHEFAVEKAKFQEVQKKQEESTDQIVRIVAKGACRIGEMKKQKDKEAQEERTRIREKIAARVMAEQAGNKEEENRLLDNAHKEYEEKQLERLRKEAAYKARLIKEQGEYREQVKERKQKDAAEKRELAKWDMINRLKTNEVINQYEHEKEQRRFDEKIQYREILNKQMKDEDTSEYDNYIKEQELLYYKNQLENEDSTFFSYANEVMDLAKSRGRSTVPIEKVVYNYKKENNLEPKKKNLTALQSKVPINNKNK